MAVSSVQWCIAALIAVGLVTLSNGALLWKQKDWSFGASPKQILDGWKGSWSWGSENAAIVRNPDGSSDAVLRMRYPEGSRNPSKSPRGGGAFYAYPFQERTHIYLTYEVYFPSGFNFVKGGKLPGLFGGSQKCSGGNKADDNSCFSTRHMWRTDGDGEVYAYITDHQRSDFCSNSLLKCNYNHGHSIGRGVNGFRFQPGKWHKVTQRVQLNRGSNKDGVLKVWVDGREKFAMFDLAYFANTGFRKVQGIMFSTFFGGSSSSWETPKTTNVYFRRFRVDTSKP